MTVRILPLHVLANCTATCSPENIVGCGLYSLLDDYVQVLC